MIRHYALKPKASIRLHLLKKLAPSVNSFKNQLDKFWNNQPLKYKFDEPYLIGTDLKIYLSEKDWLSNFLFIKQKVVPFN